MQPSGVLSKVTPQRAFLLAAIVITGAVAVALVAPLLQYVASAVLLAYVLRPLHLRLAERVGDRASAAGLITVSVVVVVVPVALLMTAALRELLRIRRAVLVGDLDLGELEALAAAGGVDLRGEVRNLTSQDLGPGLRTMIDVFGGVTEVLVGITVLVFVVYYLLKDGHHLVAWVTRTVPLDPAVQADLRRELDRITWGVVVGNVAVGLVQGLLTGIVFLGLGISNVVFWTVVTTMLSLLPLIGASVVWIPMSAYLFVSGHPVDAAVLFVLGAAVISLSDNYLRPVLTGHEAHVSPGLMVLGIFGGVLAFGFVGLFVGPVVLAFSKVLIETFTGQRGVAAE